jgi:hypothetical protein
VEARIVDGLWLDELYGLAGGGDRGAAPRLAPCLAAAAVFLVAIDDDDHALRGAALPCLCWWRRGHRRRWVGEEAARRKRVFALEVEGALFCARV